ncbi:MAG: hypothetical protein M0Z78_01105 [Betaproteobacteria bacterium]|nr:hypothetical protein [Betaproteobacteria bacterium]
MTTTQIGQEAEREAGQGKRQRLEDRLEKMFMDMLDETISEDEYKRLSSKFRGELTDIKFQTEQLQQENGESIDSAARLLELAQKASSLYLQQVSGESVNCSITCTRTLLSVVKNCRQTSENPLI